MGASVVVVWFYSLFYPEQAAFAVAGGEAVFALCGSLAVAYMPWKSNPIPSFF